MGGVETNGDGSLASESGEMWPSEMDTLTENPSALNPAEKSGLCSTDEGEDSNMVEERLMEDRLDEELLEEKHDYERLSPQSQFEDPEANPAVLETIYIAPLDGCQAELRSRVIKEVRKPGRSVYHILPCRCKPADMKV